MTCNRTNMIWISSLSNTSNLQTIMLLAVDTSQGRVRTNSSMRFKNYQSQAKTWWLWTLKRHKKKLRRGKLSILRLIFHDRPMTKCFPGRWVPHTCTVQLVPQSQLQNIDLHQKSLNWVKLSSSLELNKCVQLLGIIWVIVEDFRVLKDKRLPIDQRRINLGSLVQGSQASSPLTGEIIWNLTVCQNSPLISVDSSKGSRVIGAPAQEWLTIVNLLSHTNLARLRSKSIWFKSETTLNSNTSIDQPRKWIFQIMMLLKLL